jgi:hypothetical protein
VLDDGSHRKENAKLVTTEMLQADLESITHRQTPFH